MPIPLIALGISITVAIIIAGSGITLACLSGKKVAFIGMKASGKTTAVHAFQAIKKKDTKWKACNDTPGTLDDSKEHDVLNFKVCIDTSGSQQLKRGWKETIEKVDFVFYFFDISRLNEVMSDDFSGGEKARYCTLVKADLHDIAETCNWQKKKLIVLATHTDIEYDKNKADILCADILKEAKNYQLVKGSLKDYDSALKICELIKEKLK